MRFNWVGHSGMTSDQFGPLVCSALWLLAYRMNGSVLRLTDTINLGVTTVLQQTRHIEPSSYHLKFWIFTKSISVRSAKSDRSRSGFLLFAIECDNYLMKCTQSSNFWKY